MVLSISLLLTCIFLILSGIHFIWATGSTWGFNNALPQKENGERVLNPRKIDSLIVAIGLLTMGVFYLFMTGKLDWPLPRIVVKYGQWIIPSIFLIRGIGDFKYAGLFRKIKGTAFAKCDARFFTPLCFLIGILGFIIAYLK